MYDLDIAMTLIILEGSQLFCLSSLWLLVKAACDVFCVGDDVNIEKANDSLISNDRSWKKSKFRLTYTAEAPALTEGESSSWYLVIKCLWQLNIKGASSSVQNTCN